MSAFPRRQVLGGLAAGALLGGLSPARASTGEPDLGPNVLILDPAGSRAEAQARVDAIFRAQEKAEFGEGRFAVLLMPGWHDLDVNVGFYTTVAGVGRQPGDVVVRGHVHAEADWNRGVALVNFWRGLENLALQPPDGVDRWAVSQAAPCRRIDLTGDLLLDDGGWSSGGFLADARVRGTVRSGTQQQWFTRCSQIGGWQGSNWNMVFAGVDGAPATRFPDPPFTTIPHVSRVREKPFLHLDAHGRWAVFVPALRTDARGPSWADRTAEGHDILLSRFLLARPGMSATDLNAAIVRGQHILFTPGIYPIDAPIRINRADTILLGLGLATLSAEKNNALIEIGDVDGVVVAGLLLDAGPARSPVLLRAGRGSDSAADPRNPILLTDLFFRVGGSRIGQVETALEINRAHSIADHLWIWRADHGDRRGGRVHVGWNESVGERGLVVRGDDVTIHGLFVEHFRQHQVVWSGERGRTTFFQCELPYDPPSQSAWRPGDPRGWAAYKVADTVKQHQAIGLGIYANFTADPTIVLQSAIEAPRVPGVTFESVTTISLGKGQGTIAHLINDEGAAARTGATRQTL